MLVLGLVSTKRPELERAEMLGRRVEDSSATAALLLMALLPVLEMGLRTFFGAGIPGSAGYV